MNLSLIKLNPDCSDRTYFETVNEEAFPDSERMSFDEIFDFASKTNTDVLGIYDAEKPIGYVVLLMNSECGYIYFIAIDNRIRSKGYGGATMKKLAEMYPDLQLVLDFEELDDNAKNNEQRIRRRNFYLKNGFHETGRFTKLREDHFEVMCTGGELKQNSLKDLLRVLHEHRPELPDVLI